MELSRYAELFLSETRAHVSSINHLLLELERTGELGPVEEIFRAAHTIKGMSAAMACHTAAELAHEIEHLLDRLRRRDAELHEGLMEALFRATDALEQTIASEIAGESAPAEALESLAGLRIYGGAAPRETAAASAPAAPAPAAASPQPGPAAEPVSRVTVMIQASAALPAVRAMLVLRAARELGEVDEVEPPEEDLLAGRFAGTMRFRLIGDVDSDEVRALVLRAGEVAHVLIEEERSHGAAVEVQQGGAAPVTAQRAAAYVRLRQEHLDALVERVGELMVARDRLQRIAAANGDGELEAAAEQMARLVSETRDEVMGMRLAPIREAIDRFPRFVRDTARGLGKKVAFEVAGADTQLDRSLHGVVADLLVHLLRNALDHGIEAPAERVSAGKPPTGRLRLTAEPDRAQVIVRIEDDGRGIDRQLVVGTALAKGWLAPGEEAGVGDEELLQLLVRPGFSTARGVTDVSGRGVGLDVVSSRVSGMGGHVEVTSRKGEGTSFTLRLPLSLAILRTLQVEAAGAVYALPIASVVEVTEVGDGLRAEGGSLRMEHHEEPLPLLSLAELLGGASAPAVQETPVVVLEAPAGRFALAVDALHGHHEAVVKPFDAPAEMTQAFAGATLLEDGRPALVLDAIKLGNWVGHSPAARAGAAPGRST